MGQNECNVRDQERKRKKKKERKKGKRSLKSDIHKHLISCFLFVD